MYSEHPWPSERDADEEMGWRLKVLGIKPEDYQGKQVVELGCGTGEYALWYATHGAAEVVGVDLSDGSLGIARSRAENTGLQNIQFLKRDILKLDLPDNYFDYAYSVGVLHITGAPYAGFQQLCRITKPGGVVIVSLAHKFTGGQVGIQQRILKALAGDDLEKRARLGRRLFPRTMRSLNKRYRNANPDEVAYDTFAIPHETYYTAKEVLAWFDANNIQYLGAFAPLRFQDYLYAFSLPEYHRFKRTFEGYPLTRWTSAVLNRIATAKARNVDGAQVQFERPSALSMRLCELAWAFFGVRFRMFTIAGRKLT
jgi:ubiquinone/menaquinone biosynthesis C-methylase UbiE